ncbi:unnamed protein product [Pleuronectes platessa]|uniref:Uncharacterized protein n=1 Tax=Pleuronectes platessa TaxID=8262 RepID=A0A9N7UWE8_PLEPL|nr:unnamed protein product [Pleuronectes platessa]
MKLWREELVFDLLSDRSQLRGSEHLVPRPSGDVRGSTRRGSNPREPIQDTLRRVPSGPAVCSEERSEVEIQVLKRNVFFSRELRILQLILSRTGFPGCMSPGQMEDVVSPPLSSSLLLSPPLTPLSSSHLLSPPLTSSLLSPSSPSSLLLSPPLSSSHIDMD